MGAFEMESVRFDEKAAQILHLTVTEVDDASAPAAVEMNVIHACVIFAGILIKSLFACDVHGLDEGIFFAQFFKISVYRDEIDTDLIVLHLLVDPGGAEALIPVFFEVMQNLLFVFRAFHSSILQIICVIKYTLHEG